MFFRSATGKALSDIGLREYDWNGAGGLPVRGDTLATFAEIFISREFLHDHLASLSDPEFTLNPDGTLEMAFSEEGRELLLTFQCEGVITYIRAFEDEQTTVEGVIRVDTRAIEYADFEELSDLFTWLLKG